MKIKVEKWIVDDKYNDVSYKILSIVPCCNKLTKSKNISINNKYSEDDIYSDDNTYSVKLIRKEEEGIPWEDYSETNFYYEKIDYCPFCGEKINIEFVGEINKTEEYNKLEKERETLWNKCRKIDSKKKYNELYKQVQALDNMLNVILINDDFEKESEE